MNVPSSVAERLRLEFDDRLRIRWSVKQKNWQVEQRVARPVNPPCQYDHANDRLIRARDGYALVCQIQPGDRMSCPDCHCEIKVPILEFREVKCEWCGFAGRSGSWFPAYFPLDSEALFEHLRKIDPDRNGIERSQKEHLQNDREKQLRDRRICANEIEDVTKDSFSQMFQIQSVGYTGKTYDDGTSQ